MDNKSKYKSVLDNSEAGLFENYYLTDLMIISKNGRKVRANENRALHILLSQKLLEYGIFLWGYFEEGDVKYRSITALEGMPIENKEIFNQLYGFKNLEVPILIKNYDSYGISFEYHTSSEKCVLQKHAFGQLKSSRDFSSFKEMMDYLKEVDYENIEW